jgi:hypothetical protein
MFSYVKVFKNTKQNIQLIKNTLLNLQVRRLHRDIKKYNKTRLYSWVGYHSNETTEPGKEKKEESV